MTGSPDDVTIEELVLNDTGADWPGYYIQLGTWEDDEFIPAEGDLKFVDGSVDFDSFDELQFSDYELFFTGGMLGAGEEFQVSFNVNDPSGIGEFALRQWAVPEPSSLLLLALGSLAVLAFGRRRR